MPTEIGKISLAGAASPAFVNLISPEAMTQGDVTGMTAPYRSGMKILIHSRSGGEQVTLQSQLSDLGRTKDEVINLANGDFVIAGPFRSAEGWVDVSGNINLAVDADSVWFGVIYP